MLQLHMTLLIIGHDTPSLEQAILAELNTQLETNFTAQLHEIFDADIHILIEKEKESIGIGQVKAFTKKMHNKPLKRKLQVGIIHQFDMLTTESQNAMLKELEDHAAHTSYILGATNEQSLLSTIKSRATVRYLTNQTSKAANTDLDELAKQIIDVTPKTILSTFKKISDIEWTRATAIYVLQYMHGRIVISKNVAPVLDVLATSSQMLQSNISPKQVMGNLLLKLSVLKSQ